jgi:hypothetical protein
LNSFVTSALRSWSIPISCSSVSAILPLACAAAAISWLTIPKFNAAKNRFREHHADKVDVAHTAEEPEHARRIAFIFARGQDELRRAFSGLAASSCGVASDGKPRDFR